MQNRTIGRRSWIGGTALALAGLRANAAGKPFGHALGAQLYTVRSTIGKAEDETLRRIAEIGYTEVETTGRDNLDRIGPLLEKYKLKAVSSHLDVVAPTEGDLSAALENLKKHGVEYVVHPYVPPAQRGDAEGYKKLAAALNQAGSKCHAAGLTLCYHNHAFEFGGAEGQRPIDIFDANLDRKLVQLEMDVFWVSVAGHDPVEMLNRYRGRVPLVHLKDKAQGTPVMYDERVPKETFKEVGSGTLDFAAILGAAEKAGAKHFFVEQDQTPGDPVDSLAKSYRNLRGLTL